MSPVSMSRTALQMGLSTDWVCVSMPLQLYLLFEYKASPGLESGV